MFKAVIKWSSSTWHQILKELSAVQGSKILGGREPSGYWKQNYYNG